MPAKDEQASHTKRNDQLIEKKELCALDGLCPSPAKADMDDCGNESNRPEAEKDHNPLPGENQFKPCRVAPALVWVAP
jgi:hypothetical protein